MQEIARKFGGMGCEFSAKFENMWDYIITVK